VVVLSLCCSDGIFVNKLYQYIYTILFVVYIHNSICCVYRPFYLLFIYTILFVVYIHNSICCVYTQFYLLCIYTILFVVYINHIDSFLLQLYVTGYRHKIRFFCVI